MICDLPAIDRYLAAGTERELFIDNLLVRINFIIEMIWWTGLAPWQFDLRMLEYSRRYMMLGRCPLSIFCSRGTPPR